MARDMTHFHDRHVATIALKLQIHSPISCFDGIYHVAVLLGIPNVITKGCTTPQDLVSSLQRLTSVLSAALAYGDMTHDGSGLNGL